MSESSSNIQPQSLPTRLEVEAVLIEIGFLKALIRNKEQLRAAMLNSMLHSRDDQYLALLVLEAELRDQWHGELKLQEMYCP